MRDTNPARTDALSAAQDAPPVAGGGAATVTAEEAAALVARQTTEESFRRALHKTARDYGWKAYHTRFSLGSDAGFPDELYVRGERCVVVECKRVGKEPTEKQWEWLRALGAVPGIESYTWTPEDWNHVHAVLGWPQQEGGA